MEGQSLGFLVSAYQDIALAENKSPRTIKTVIEAVAQFDRFLTGCQNASSLTAKDLRSYIRFLQQQQRWADHPNINGPRGNLSPHTVASNVRSVKAFFSTLKKSGLIQNNPLAAVAVPKVPRNLPKVLTSEQVGQLCAAILRTCHIGYRDFAIVVTLYGTGLRVSELLNLLLDDVDFDIGEIRVMGKGAKERWVYMSPKVSEILSTYVCQWRPAVDSRYVFVHADGRLLDRSYVIHRLRKYRDKAGLAGIRVTAHGLRYAFAIEFLRNGGDVFTLQRILGHSTLEMTCRYAVIADQDVEIKMKTLSPAEKLAAELIGGQQNQSGMIP